ncbi:hypothetical protein AKJ65_06755 [candidate division MSBL1 archaeon SCGC-AAA259E19]|uniref:Oxidoreductase FAD/NAD(P)-binding domain-containing protein n=1 Tax=candidate division MSBL1 archaeon SCGC-AAA259E19 TaxID=1698264 RepID=A0A133UFW3_9EURY|nr:hypothetical protein AKJ65_06755 [candidate division MSBL1 archaeon SCGC-AAA259E19]
MKETVGKNRPTRFSAEIKEASKGDWGKVLKLRFQDGSGDKLNFKPGQSIVIFGKREETSAPIISPPTFEGELELLLEGGREDDSPLGTMREGTDVLLGGLHGRGYPVEDAKGNNLLFITGGTGLARLRSAIEYVYQTREEYKEAQIIYGGRSSADFLFQEDFSRWGNRFDLRVGCEKKGLNNEKELISNLLSGIKINGENSSAFMAGPQILYKFFIPYLTDIGFRDKEIYLYFGRDITAGNEHERGGVERKIAKEDGPVLSYTKIKKQVGPLFEQLSLNL